MKIYYRYNGFIRSSELNLIENVEEEFRETFVLLGEFGEEIYDLFGIVLVEKSWNSSGMSYNISGFNKTGNGNLGYYEGETLQVLYNIFEESWDYIQTEEEALEQLDISVERLDVEIVPNPDKLNDKDDLYTYLDPSQRIIKSCSRVKVKVPAPNIECIPVSVNMISTAPESEYIEPATKLTMSKNNGPKFTIDTYFSGSPEDPDFEDNIAAYQKKLVEAMYLAEDKTSMAFIPSMFVNSITTERVTENLCGLTSQGLLLYDDNLYSLNDGFYDMRDVFNPSSPPSLRVPLNIVSETTTVNFYPTVGLPKEKDSYYMFEGSDDLGTPVTVISCAKIIATKFLDNAQEQEQEQDLGQYEAFYVIDGEEVALENISVITEKLKQSHLNGEYGDIPPPRSWVTGDTYYGINVSIFEKDKAFTGVPSIYNDFEYGVPKDPEAAAADYLIEIENLMNSKFDKLNGNVYVPKEEPLPVDQIGGELIVIPMEGITQHILYNENGGYIGNSQSYTYFDISVRRIL